MFYYSYISFKCFPNWCQEALKRLDTHKGYERLSKLDLLSLPNSISSPKRLFQCNTVERG